MKLGKDDLFFPGERAFQLLDGSLNINVCFVHAAIDFIFISLNRQSDREDTQGLLFSKAARRFLASSTSRRPGSASFQRSRKRRYSLSAFERAPFFSYSCASR